MGVLSFRSPQEGLEQLTKAMDIISLIKEIVENPEVSKTIKDLSQKLAAAQELSDKKRKEVFDAEELIAQSKELIDDIEKEKVSHAKEVARFNAEMATARSKLDRDLVAFSEEKAKLLDSIAANKAEVQEKLKRVNEINEESKTRSSNAEKFEIALRQREEELAKTIAEFERTRADVEVTLTQKLDAAEDMTRKLNADRQAFELRKKKFEEALAG